MKKFLAILLTLIMVLSMVACGTKPAQDTGETLDKAGTYTGEYDVLTITAPDVTVENATASKIIVAKEVGDGDVTLKNVTVDTLEVYGGGENSVHLFEAIIKAVVSHKEEGIVRIVAETKADVGHFDATNTIVVIREGATVTGITANANTTVIVEQAAVAGEVVVADTTATAQVEGEVKALTVDAPAATVAVAETAKVEEVKLTEKAEEATVEIKGEAAKVTVEAPKAAVAVAETAVVVEVKVAETATGTKTDIAGTVTKLETAAANTETTVAETAKVEEVKVAETAADTALVVEGTVTKVDTEATTTVAGNGTVETVETSDKNNVTLPENSSAAQGATVTQKPGTTTPSTTPTTPTTPTEPPKEEETTPPTSSGGGTYVPPHSHTYDTANWSKDATHHWHAATCEHTTEVNDKAEHTGTGIKCDVCGAYINLPKAGISVFGAQDVTGLYFDNSSEDTTIGLQASYRFTAKDTYATAQDSPYKDWNADYVVSADKLIGAGTIVLAGQYINYSKDWLAFTNPNDVAADEDIRLLSLYTLSMSYAELCKDVQAFNCGVKDVNGALAANDTTFTVELRLFEVVNGTETGEYVTVNTVTYNFKTGTTTVLPETTPIDFNKTGENEYAVNTAAGLAAFRDSVNGGNTYAGKTVKLAADIDLGDEEWTPIGLKESDVAFAGVFDGASKTISGLNITASSLATGEDYGALFSLVTGTVKNLNVTGSVTAYNAAGIVGVLRGGTIDNCRSSVTVNGAGKAGGVAVMANNSNGVSTIKNCTNNGAVNGGISGGIMALAHRGTSFDTCVNNGAVTRVDANSNQYAGGILGYVQGTEPLAGNSNITTFTGCSNTGAVSGATNCGAIVGFVTSGSPHQVTNCMNTVSTLQLVGYSYNS